MGKLTALKPACCCADLHHTLPPFFLSADKIKSAFACCLVSQHLASLETWEFIYFFLTHLMYSFSGERNISLVLEICDAEPPNCLQLMKCFAELVRPLCLHFSNVLLVYFHTHNVPDFLPVFLQAASMALSSLGHVYTAIGDYPNALASHKQCVLLAKQSKDQLSEARELGNMGAVYIAMGDFDNAVQCHEQHLGIAKALENKREEARAYSNLGSAYHYHRNFDKAMSYHTHVLELAQELEEKSIEMRAYAGLGHAARCMQDLERAKQYHEQQLSIAEGLKDRAAEGRASSNLGMYEECIALKYVCELIIPCTPRFSTLN